MRIGLDAYIEANDLFNQGFTFMEQGRWDFAVELFTCSAKIHDLSPQCHGNMGLCHAYLGNKAKALAELDRALEIDPAYKTALDNRKAVAEMVDGEPLKTTFISNNPVGKRWLK